MTKDQLIEELEKMHRQVSALQAAESCYRQTEEALRKSSEEIQDLYDNSPCGYHSLNEDGIFVKINNTELSWLGYSRDEITGKKFSDVITPKSIDVFKENFSRFKELGWVRDLEFELIRKDGSMMPVLLSATAVKDEAGNFMMSRSTLFNITDRKRVEEALIESEKKYRLLVENSNDIIYTTNLKGHFVYVNPVAERVIGCPGSELIGKHYLSLVRPDFHEEIDAFYKKQYFEKIPNTYFEFPILTGNGTTKWLGQNVQLLSDNEKIAGFQAVVRDITDRRAAEEKMAALNKELEEANRQLGLAYSQMKDNRDHLRKHLFEEEMGFLVDGEGLIKGMTERVLEHAGRPRDELTGTNIADLFHENCRETFMDELRQAWIGVSSRISVEMTAIKEDKKFFEIKITRITLDGKKLLLVVLR
jgi:PAS domain S-box-containing protein